MSLQTPIKKFMPKLKAKNQKDLACGAIMQLGRIVKRNWRAVSDEVDGATTQRRRISAETLRKVNVMAGTSGRDINGALAAINDIIDTLNSRQYITCTGNAIYKDVVTWVCPAVSYRAKYYLSVVRDDVEAKI